MSSPAQPSPRILVHGGAGPWRNLPQRDAAEDVCKEAAERGRACLLAGGSALDAVEQAVNWLEDSPLFDAGCGSYANREGIVQMDAFIMDGRSLDLGAVAVVRELRYPISLARRVMQDSPHAMLAGPDAERFAAQLGLERMSNAALLPPTKPSEAETQSWGALGDTVGAVALDAAGHLACATSTGGTTPPLPGRVGDCPLVGSGGYADDASAAVSSTGEGEALMKLVIAKRAVDLVAGGSSPQSACEAAIAELEQRLGGSQAGLIAFDRRGALGIAHNCGAMPHAHALGDAPVVSGR